MLRTFIVYASLIAGCLSAAAGEGLADQPTQIRTGPGTFVRFHSGDAPMDRAFRIALGDLVTNIQPHQAGLLTEERHVVMAGLEYGRPWTRDAAINTWNGAGLLFPEATRDTLLSVLDRRDGQIFIGGQYWDCIIWTIGAWQQYLYTGDLTFLATALDAVTNTLEFLEATEFDATLGLFRGAASSSDGVAGYPVIYAQPGGFSGIADWPRNNPDLAHDTGYGVPIHALSTNCLYYRAYVLAQRMAAELDRPIDPHWKEQAATIKKAITDQLWREEAGLYRYLVDPFGGCDYTECLGHAYAILFGIADAHQTERILKNQYIAPAGVPVLWPTFERYRIPHFHNSVANGFGRHSGCVWPSFEAIWATTAKAHGRGDLFMDVLRRQAVFACRDSQFVEIYHPVSGEPYGGLQEGRGNPRTHETYASDIETPHTYLIGEWDARVRQTWSATGYLRMILLGLIGMDFSPEGITFAPHLSEDLPLVRLDYLPYRGMTLDIRVEGSGSKIAEFTVNGETHPEAFLPAEGTGQRNIRIRLGSG